ncbi:MAG: Arc family DNA-binding protein [Gammaproteobacteria bacterium]|uniref:Putative Arc repressor family protein n=1 Tax=viral metagenome TaxID=1070528 RepID=A0A6H2A0P0_9ZZZZ|nr:Arc family DNA-binding protein [Gammaproteobacteria bacterium]MBU2157132.1 Arc family DNA-binding protein [Gammaproteobacteria bacterium]MBU2256046.1 Arc family DNA-binding protein [Gammaproteobacteria bacterium]MBU2295114.1 Arc family DNA-binding protein [Gammaproteobacteria bacterium]
MDTEDRYTRITLRIPKDLHAWLSQSADDTSKSMNAEIIARLERSFEGDALGLDKDVLDVLALQSTLTLVLLDGLDTSSLTSIQQTAANALHKVAKSMSDKLVLNKGADGHRFGTLPTSHTDHPEHPDFEPSKK